MDRKRHKLNTENKCSQKYPKVGQKILTENQGRTIPTLLYCFSCWPPVVASSPSQASYQASPKDSFKTQTQKKFRKANGSKD